jgi:hypothetical protein
LNQKSKYILLFNIYFEDFENNINYFSDGVLFIIILVSITFLEHQCFSECSSLTHISLPHSIKSFGKGCFANCQNLNEVNHPSSFGFIDNQIFFSCLSL